MVLVKSPEIAQRLKAMRRFGHIGRDDDITMIGLNYRMTDIQAALGNSQMRRFLNTLDRRRRLHRWYQDELNVQCGWSVLYRSRNASGASTITHSCDGV